MTDQPSSSPSVAGRTPPRSARRRWLAIALSVITVLLVLLANVAFWANSTLLDSDEFTDKVSGVLQRPESSDRIGDVLSERILRSGEVQDRITQALPENAQFLPVLFEDQLQNGIANAISRLASLDASAALETTAIRRLHTTLVATLKGRETGLTVQDDSLVLDLNETVKSYLARLDARLGTDFESRADQEGTGRVVLVSDTKALDQASFAVRALDTSVPVLIVLSLAALAGVVFLAPTRSSGFSTAGLIVMIAGLISLLLWRIAGTILGGYLEESPIARDIIDALIVNLRTQSIVLLVAGGIVVLVSEVRVRGWITEQSTRATGAVQAFGVGRSALVGAAGLAVAILVS